YTTLIVFNNCVFDNTSGLSFSSTSSTLTYTNALFRNTDTLALVDSTVINSSIIDSSGTTLTAAPITNTKISYCINLTISSVIISYSTFENMINASFSF